MKKEMFEFLFGMATGHEYEILPPARAPYGQIVYGEKYVPRHLRPMFEGHKTYPELSRRYSPVFAGAARVVGPPLLVSYPFVTATAHYPEVAGPQYQSAMSGQMGIGSSALTMQKPTSIREVFTWGYWQGY